VGAGGKILLVEPQISGALELAESDAAMVTRALGGPYISPLQYEPLTKTPVVFASVPIRSGAGAGIGILSMAINVKESSISSIIDPITLGSTGYAEVMDSNGVVLARTNPGRPPDPFELSDHPDKFSLLISQGRATVRTCHRCHGTLENPQRSSRDVLAFAPLQNASWGVAIRQSEAEAFAIRDQLKRRLFLLGGIVVVGAFLLVWNVTQGVVRPVRALTEAARRVASGDFKVNVPVSGKDEIGQLGVSFGAMTRQLGVAREELVSRNKELSSLNSIAATVGQSLNIDEVLAKSLARVAELTGSIGGCVFLVHGENRELKIHASLGPAARIFDCHRMSVFPACTCNQATRIRQTLLVDDVSQCPALGEWTSTQEHLEEFVAVPLRSKEHCVGLMNLCFGADRIFTEQDFRLLDAVGNYVGLAVDNALLYQEAKQKERLRGQLLNSVISAQEEERKRLARELHDEFGQTLTGVIMAVDSVKDAVPAQHGALNDALTRTRSVTLRALQDLRKIIRGLRSAVLDELGLVAAVRSYAEEHLESAGIAMVFQAEGMTHRLPSTVETALFRIAQEAVNNAIRHSGASTTTIVLRAEKNKAMLSVQDDGKGFDTEEFFARGSEASLGILGMRERVALLGGTFSVVSGRGLGTRIVVEVSPEVPVAEAVVGKEEAISG